MERDGILALKGKALASSPLSRRSARFKAFELDLRAGELRTGAQKIRLQGKPFQMLVLLLESPGEVVTRDEIRKKLWANDTIVEFDHGIGTALKKLRHALSDDAAHPRYIETGLLLALPPSPFAARWRTSPSAISTQSGG